MPALMKRTAMPVTIAANSTPIAAMPIAAPAISSSTPLTTESSFSDASV
jgi:hypothetical protein